MISNSKNRDPEDLSHEAAGRVLDRVGEKITLMGLLRDEDSRAIMGAATFLLGILTLFLVWTLLSDIRSEIRMIRTETEGNTLHVNRIEERVNWLEKRLERIENKQQ